MEDQELIEEATKAAGKILASAFKACGLKEKIESMLVDENTGEEFVLTFYPSGKFLKYRTKEITRTK